MPRREPDPSISSQTANTSHCLFRRLLHDEVGHVCAAFLTSSHCPTPPDSTPQVRDHGAARAKQQAGACEDAWRGPAKSAIISLCSKATRPKQSMQKKVSSSPTLLHFPRLRSLRHSQSTPIAMQDQPAVRTCSCEGSQDPACISPSLGVVKLHHTPRTQT